MYLSKVGRSFFTPPPGRVMSLGGGMDVWVGLFQSAILGWKPLLNVDGKLYNRNRANSIFNVI